MSAQTAKRPAFVQELHRSANHDGVPISQVEGPLVGFQRPVRVAVQLFDPSDEQRCLGPRGPANLHRGEEAPGWHNVSTTPAWQDAVVQDVRDMVIRDRSRPSVIIWGTRLNETGDYPGLWAATRQAARKLDPTRPSTGGSPRRNGDA